MAEHGLQNKTYPLSTGDTIVSRTLASIATADSNSRRVELSAVAIIQALRQASGSAAKLGLRQSSCWPHRFCHEARVHCERCRVDEFATSNGLPGTR